MLEQEENVDLSGEAHLDCEMFRVWLDVGELLPEQCPCAVALRRYALDQQGEDLRGGVNAGTAWELCCRVLSLPPETKTLGSRDLAQLLVYWLDKKYVPEEMATTIYDGMVPDLFDRGKRVETEGDEAAMKCRWVKQLVHRELDVAREE